MNSDTPQKLTLRLPADAIYLPVVTPFVESAAVAFGLQKEAALRLGLATEEIFVHLSREVCRGEPLEINCLNGVSYARVEFRFSGSKLNMGALNMTATCKGEENIAEMGLIIASRTIDRLHITSEKFQQVCLAIEKDKDYPAVTETIPLPTGSAGDFTVETPDTETLKRFVTLAVRNDDPLQPDYLRYPGKVADMAAVGQIRALVAITPKRDIAGGVLLCFQMERIVQIIGPYAFDSRHKTDIFESLLAACLSGMARTKAMAILSMGGIPAEIQSQFEPLGTLSYYLPSGNAVARHLYYRLLHEDPGCVIWADGSLRDYLSKEYQRLYLAREIREVKDFGETRSGASIFSAAVTRLRSEVILRPLWPGADMDENVKRHIACVKEESLRNILFMLDMGVSWHAVLMPILVDNGFKPALILPFAGQSDMVVFQYHEH
ncbi:MAG: hypothetical protein CSYNP_01947 [Syntrophus sp. SKADARSKE-3]|nr:hypothetical protein [Syntrophus sp. SKADARSKE-3]